MKKFVKILLLVIVGLIVAGISAAVFFGKDAAEEKRTHVVTRQTVRDEVSFTGNLESEHVVTLGFEAGGTIDSLDVKVGDFVQEGQLLAHVDSRMSELELAKARADRLGAQDEALLTYQHEQTEYEKIRAENARMLEQKRQTVRDAKKELDQQKDVLEQKVRESGDESSIAKSAQSAVLSAETAYRAAQQALSTEEKSVIKRDEQAKAAVETANLNYTQSRQASSLSGGLSSVAAQEALSSVKVQKSSMRAPLSGTITATYSNAGEYVATGAPVMTIEHGNLQIVAHVAETEALSLLPGQKAEVTFDAFDSSQIWQARVTFVAPVATIIEGLPTYEIKLAIDTVNAQPLRAGLTANAIVHIQEQTNVLTIPRRAIIRQDGRTFVQVPLSDGTTEERTIVTGLIGSDGMVEVVSGLKEGDTILLDTPDTEE